MAKKRIADEEMRFNLVVNGNQAQKELYETEKALRDLKEEGKGLREERKRLRAQGKQDTKEYKRVTAAIKENSAAVKTNQTRMESLRKQVGITGMTIHQLNQRARQLRAQLRHMIPGSEQALRYEAELTRINARLKELRMRGGAAESSLSKLAVGMNKYFLMASTVVATLTGIVFSLQRYIDYNAKLSDSQADVMKTTGMTREEVDKLSRSFGLMRTRTARSELLDLATEAGRLGITGVKNINDFVEVANKMKVALGDILSDEEIREVGKMANVYRVGEQTGRDFKDSMEALGSALNEVGASGANTEKYLVNYLRRQAGVAVQAKVSAANNIGYAATFDEIGQSVEVSATAMNKVWMDMFQNTETYAKIAGMSIQEFTELLNTDSNEAMIRFLEGLNGNNEGLSVMVQKLADIEVGGARGAQALSAIAGQTELLRKRQKTANEALEEATSLTEEYEIKNNNLAASIDKIQKRIMAWLTAESLTRFLSDTINTFGRLIGAIESANKAFDRNTKTAFENIKANRQLATESEMLLKRYEKLIKDGIDPATDAKEELDLITLQLKDRLGESVVQLDKETNSFILNTEEVRKQIAVKRLAADQEASTLASRLIGVNDEIESLENRKELAENELRLRQKYYNTVSKQQEGEIMRYQHLSMEQRLRMIRNLKGYKEMTDAEKALLNIQEEINEQLRRQEDIRTKLKDLYFDPDAAQDLLTGGDIGPKEGDKQLIDGVWYIYKNGSWEPMVIPTGSYNTGRLKEYEKLQDEILAATRAAEDNRIALLNDSYLIEIHNLQIAHKRKLETLQQQMLSEKEILAAPAQFREDLRERNKAVNRQIETEENLHQLRLSEIITKGIAQQMQENETLFERKMNLLKQKHARELLEFEGSSAEYRALRDRHQEEELQAQAAFLEEQLRQAQSILSSEDFGGMDLSILTPEQREALEAQLDAIKLKLLEVREAKDAISNPSKSGKDGIDEEENKFGSASGTDILGFTPEQWEETFSNLDTTQEKIIGLAQAVAGMANAWQMYNQFVSANEQKRFEEFEKNNKAQEESLKRRLDKGLINQRQYEDAMKKLEDRRQEEAEELNYRQQLRQWQASIVQSISNTALAGTQALATAAPPYNMYLAGLMYSLGAAQTAIIRSQKPVKGYEDGLYPDWLFPVKREQDGKVFNARFGGNAKSGMVNDPTILVGEKPEMIISNPDLKRFDPAVTAAVVNEIRRVRGYESGYTSPAAVAAADRTTPTPTDNPELMATLIRISVVLENLEANGVMAYLVRDMENTKLLQEDIERLKKYREKSRV